MDLRQQLGVETPEHVEVHLELAGVGSRTAAAFFDTVLLNLGVILIVVVARTIGTRLSGAVEGWLMAALVLLYYFAVLGYFVLFEALNGGRTPGKQALGIRVVMASGHPVTRAAATSGRRWSCGWRPSWPVASRRACRAARRTRRRIWRRSWRRSSASAAAASRRGRVSGEPGAPRWPPSGSSHASARPGKRSGRSPRARSGPAWARCRPTRSPRSERAT